MLTPEIIFEDQDIIVVNKPSGMPTQSSQIKKTQDLYSWLQKLLNQRENKEVYLALHHRLDAATSGLILLCKNKKYNKYITELFREKKIEKKYMTIVDIESELINKQWEVSNKLIEYRFKHFKKAKMSAKGKSAITHFKLIDQTATKALVECTPKTGRLHQIRVHLADNKMPVQGDFHYNKNYKGSDFALCAYYLSFQHPRTKKILEIKIDFPFKLI